MSTTDSLNINQLIDIYGKSLAFLGVIATSITAVLIMLWKGAIKSREYQHTELVKKIEQNATATSKGIDEIKEDLKPLTLKVERHSEKLEGIDGRMKVVEAKYDDIHQRVYVVERSVDEIIKGYKDN